MRVTISTYCFFSIIWIGLTNSKDFASFSIIYFILFFLFLIDLINKPFVYTFRPSSIILLFTTINFSLGNYAFYKKYFLLNHISKFETIFKFDHLKLANQYFIVTLLLVYLLNYKNVLTPLNSKLQLGRKTLILPYFTLLLGFNFINIDSNIIEILKVGLVITLILNISTIDKNRVRTLLYFLAICLFSITAYNDKRNILLALLAIILVEINFNQLFKLKDIIKIVIGFFGLVLLLSLLTIFRGYGGFELVNDWMNLPNYIKLFFSNSNVLAWILHISESYTTYFHSVQVVEYVLDSSNYLYGSTIFKAFFVPFPSEFIEKPWSIIDQYTYNLYPAFRRVKGALAPNALGEFFFNFGFIGSILFSFLTFIFDLIYSCLFKNKILSNICFWFVIFILPFIRGSGLDMYLAYVYTCQLFTLINLSTIKNY